MREMTAMHKTMGRQIFRYSLIGTAIVIWAALVGTGFWWLADYANAEGQVNGIAATWPETSKIDFDPQQPNLLLFVHPHCPCSRASVAELERIWTRQRNVCCTTVVFVRPPSCEPGWEKTNLWRQVARIPGIRLAIDAGGIECRQFGAATSGQTMLYSPRGHLLFHGGITPSRGHEGKSVGRAIIEELLSEQVTTDSNSIRQSKVFGCPLLDT